MNQAPSKLHLAIIPDGNRRWARERSFNPWKGHEAAIENFRTITEWCRTHPRIGILTVWCFSTENWKRDPEEIAKLMDMLEQYLLKERKGFIDKKTRFVHSGRKDRIPPSLAKLIGDVQEETKDQTGFTLHLAVDYGGKDEILRAIDRIERTSQRANEPTSQQVAIDQIPTEESFREYLDHPELPDIDLIIRTSGEKRTSNFFLWQTSYSEWLFLDKYFPDMNTVDIEEALKEFEERKRRFGS